MRSVEKYLNAKEKIKMYFAAALFITLGILIIIIFANSNIKSLNWIQTDGKILDITNKITSVSYYVESSGELFISNLNEYSSSWRVGDTIAIKYNPDNPSEIASASLASAVLPIVIGGVFIVCGLVVLIKQLIKDFRKKDKDNDKEQNPLKKFDNQ